MTDVLPARKLSTGLRDDKFGNRTIRPGDTVQVDLKVSETVTHQSLRIPVIVMRGEKLGPTMFITGAVHGDEINGVAIVRRLLDDLEGKLDCGTLIAVPVANRFGFESQSRYLPDRRDLNRHFPGDSQGSMASRIADVLFRKVIAVSDYGIDLHTAAHGNSNLCHIRADSEVPALKDMMKAFGAPIMMHSEGPKGSLRRAATAYGVPTMIFEAGEPRRFQHHVVEIGQAGVLNVMAHLGMIERRRKTVGFQTLLRRSSWVRADYGGILDMEVEPGDLVRSKQKMGAIQDPFGRDIDAFYAPHAGVVIGKTTLPLCNPGMAMVHIGHLDKTFNRAREYVAGGGELGHVNFTWQMARKLARAKRTEPPSKKKVSKKSATQSKAATAAPKKAKSVTKAAPKSKASATGKPAKKAPAKRTKLAQKGAADDATSKPSKRGTAPTNASIASAARTVKKPAKRRIAPASNQSETSAD